MSSSLYYNHFHTTSSDSAHNRIRSKQCQTCPEMVRQAKYRHGKMPTGAQWNLFLGQWTTTPPLLHILEASLSCFSAGWWWGAAASLAVLPRVASRGLEKAEDNPANEA